MAPDLLSEVKLFRTLEEAMTWALARTPPAEFFTVVAQDEFTLDVVIRVAPDVFLAFDTN